MKAGSNTLLKAVVLVEKTIITTKVLEHLPRFAHSGAQTENLLLLRLVQVQSKYKPHFSNTYTEMRLNKYQILSRFNYI